MSSIAGSNVSKHNSVLESLRLNDPKQEEAKPTEKTIKIPADSLSNKKIEKGPVPQSAITISSDSTFSGNEILVVGQNKFTHVRPLVQGMELEEAKNIIKDNKVDEIIFKNEDGKLFIAFGGKETKGSLNLESIREGHIGKMGNSHVKIVHINNETNTVKEGAIAPLTSTWANIKDAGATGITKGIAEMGTTVVAIFIGKSIVQNGMTAVSTAQAAASIGEAAGGAIKGVNIVKEAGSTGKAIISTVGSGIKQVGVGVAVAGAVIGTVAGVMSIYGAISGSRPKNDFTTIDMLTDQSLSFIPRDKK